MVLARAHFKRAKAGRLPAQRNAALTGHNRQLRLIQTQSLEELAGLGTGGPERIERGLEEGPGHRQHVHAIRAAAQPQLAACVRGGHFKVKVAAGQLAGKRDRRNRSAAIHQLHALQRQVGQPFRERRPACVSRSRMGFGGDFQRTAVRSICESQVAQLEVGNCREQRQLDHVRQEIGQLAQAQRKQRPGIHQVRLV